MINSLEKLLKENGDKLTEDEKSKLTTAIDDCKKKIDCEDTEQIKKALEDLTSTSSSIISKLYVEASKEAQAKKDAESNNNKDDKKDGDDEIIIDDKDKK